MSENKQTIRPKAKRAAPHSAWKKGQSGNPKGAPKRGESWAEIIKRVGEMTPGEAAERSLSLAKQLLEIGEGVTLKEAVVLRVYGALLFEPQSGLLNAFMERAEGKIVQPVDVSWKDEARKRGIDPEEISAYISSQLAGLGTGAGDTGSDSGDSGSAEPAVDMDSVTRPADIRI